MLVGLWGADKAERREWSALETECCHTATLSVKLQRVSPVQGMADSDRLGEGSGQAVMKYRTETKKAYTVSFTY